LYPARYATEGTPVRTEELPLTRDTSIVYGLAELPVTW
jgi:hypothetical protein